MSGIQEPSNSNPEGSFRQSASTRPVQSSDYQEELLQDSEDSIWGMLVPVKQTKFETVHLTEDAVKFGRDTKCQFYFHRRKHRLSKDEFKNLSKEQFSIIRDDMKKVYIIDHSMNGTFVNGVRPPANRRIPLQHNAVLSMALPHKKCFIFFNRMLIRQQHENIPRGFGFYYTLEDGVLGRGRFGVVKTGFKNTNFHDKVAVKIITKTNTKETKYEFEIMKNISHPNIVNTLDYFENNSVCYIVMEYMDGGDLCEYIRKNGPITDQTAKFWFKQVIEGVRFLHTKNIVHRDIKPENVLLSCDHDGVDVLKLSDFGISRFLAQDSVMKTYAGTSMYRAPEIPASQNGYDISVDVWSLGCLLYVMLVGSSPFKHNVRVNREVLASLFRKDDWRNLSPQAQDFCSKMLVIIPSKRIQLDAALEHCWFGGDDPIKEGQENPPKRQKIL